MPPQAHDAHLSFTDKCAFSSMLYPRDREQLVQMSAKRFAGITIVKDCRALRGRLGVGGADSEPPEDYGSFKTFS